MTNYFEWPKRKLSVTTLRLDYENPRLTQFGSKPNQSEIIDYLIENEKVLDLAKSIIVQSYFLNEQPIVTKENNKFVVLEGNRRVAACKILINPDLIKSDNKRNSLKKLLKDFDLSIIGKLEVYIAPDRSSADDMIVNRHTGGSVVEKWDKTKQDRFIYNRFTDGESIESLSQKFSISKGDIKKAIRRYNVFSEINKLDLEEQYKKVLREEVKFSMTNVERVYDSKFGRDFLGVNFDDEGKIKKLLPKEEFSKRLKTIVEKVIKGEINSRTLNTEKEKEVYLKNLIKSDTFDSTIELDEKYADVEPDERERKREEEEEKKEKELVKTGRTTSSVKLINGNLHFITGIKRIDDIFNEMKDLNIKKHPNSIAVLLRSYIDMVTYQFLKKNNGIREILIVQGLKLKQDNEKTIKIITDFFKTEYKIEEEIDIAKLSRALKLNGGISKEFTPSLRYMLDHLTKSDLISEPKLKSTLQSYLNKDSKVDKVIGHNEFNLLVHNEYYINDQEGLKSVWDKLESILEYMVNNIKSKR
jgi:hypothetical protein